MSSSNNGFCIFLMVFFSLEMILLGAWLAWWTLQKHRQDVRRKAKQSYRQVSTEGDDWKPHPSDEPLFQQKEGVKP